MKLTKLENKKLFEGIDQPKLEWAKEWLLEPKKLYINGEFIDSHAKEWHEVRNPVRAS